MQPALSVVDSEIPDPPYPRDIEANGWSPQLHIDRIMTSDTWIMAEDDERPWLLRVWFECWRSVPVGSMPDNRKLFARRIGCSRQFLEAHGETLLRGWRLHSDGRLYHDYIASQVLEMLTRRFKDSEKMRKYRNRQKTKENKGNTESVTVTDGNVTVSNGSVTGGREGKGREGKETPAQNTQDGCAVVPPVGETTCISEVATRKKNTQCPAVAGPTQHSGKTHTVPATTGVWRDPPAAQKPREATMIDQATAVLDLLNQESGSNFRATNNLGKPTKNALLVMARAKEHGFASCAEVIKAKVSEWASDPKWSKYLRPSTLFGAEKFEQYLGQAGAKPKEKEWGSFMRLVNANDDQDNTIDSTCEVVG